jgi:hypothetical protein
MAYIPENARWYLADIVLKHVVQDDPRNVVHINIHLIEAASPELAYEKACALGRESQIVFPNTDGKEVRTVFRGIRGLTVIHDKLEDGAELIYEELIGVPEAKLAGLVSPKADLAVFRERQSGFATGAPNLMPESVMEKMGEAGFVDRITNERKLPHKARGQTCRLS